MLHLKTVLDMVVELEMGPCLVHCGVCVGADGVVVERIDSVQMAFEPVQLPVLIFLLSTVVLIEKD